ncbi:transcriptional regulator [Paenibacillus sp. PK3_47]|uniref:ArsR/SmtB family transcription factor n=1 Tax=Paenibacillus sp. PK3_47 TaxID=2072642 RepID=UPI00201E68A1|nr:winged helix-turn-helix domain-containing protein [Paenibacillus sp. PK3_47]UQZ36458.1 transcriptional regulator [Paenibacillus sp. PK3_47]
MKTASNLAQIAALVSEDSRAVILSVLMDGRFHAAGELAYMAGIQPQTASFHLAKMVQAGAVAVEKQGRHRYYGIKDQQVAQVMESLLFLAPPVEIKSLRQSAEDQALRYARTCYDHLAGSLGVQLTKALLNTGVLCEELEGYEVTGYGEKIFTDLLIDLEQVRKKKRSFSHKCLDWSERRHHLAGALGNAILEKLLEMHWVQRHPASRAISITSEGEKGLREVFSLDINELAVLGKNK